MTKNLFLICCAILMASSLSESHPTYADDEASMTVPEIITKYGYPVEEHFITTASGYILRLHRIPHSKSATAPSTKPVFLQHGILSSSADWIIAGPEHSLGFILADHGYDVWMGNARGNALSRNHTLWDPNNSDEFWDFSWHEIGTEDLPTMIDYVLEQTQQQDLFYIGHSQGTTSFYVMASSLPEYNAKIRAHFSLAPIAFMHHLTSPLLQLISWWNKPLEFLMDIIGVNEYFPNNPLITAGADLLCNDNSIFQSLCTNGLFVLCGFSQAEMNATLLPTIAGHTPAGASTRQLLHYAQEIRSSHFRQYDWGLLGNMKRYGHMTPPDYELKKITAPVYLFYSHNDWMAAEVDVNNLYDKLPNAKGKFLNGDSGFNHLDYMYGIRARETVYNRVVSLMNSL